MSRRLNPDEFYSPVPGEPSLGTPHPHYERLVTNVSPGTTAYQTVTCSNLPAGVTQIYIRIQANSMPVGDFIDAQTDGTPTPVDAPVIATQDVLNKVCYATGFVKLTAAKTFTYHVSQAGATGVYVIMFYYWA